MCELCGVYFRVIDTEDASRRFKVVKHAGPAIVELDRFDDALAAETFARVMHADYIKNLPSPFARWLEHMARYAENPYP